MNFSEALLKQCGFLAGPTASGKTQLALHLAEQLNGEIISLDSMAIYRGMDIGTAKPSVGERLRIPHHLIDVAEPHQEFTVAQFLEMANVAAQQIASRGSLPLFVGGTGLYLRSVLRGLSAGPEADWVFRRELEAESLLHDQHWLHHQLMAVDPVTASRLHPNDRRRIIRALEVFRLTGRKLSDDQTQIPLPAERRPRFVVWLSPPREWLYQRINQRVDQMMSEGLLEEVRALAARIPAPGRTAMQALGYRELFSHLRGECSLQEAVEQIKIGTRQFAKRQHTWFRNLEECRTLPIAGDESPGALSAQIIEGVSAAIERRE